MKEQIITFETCSDGYKETYPFKMIKDVQESDYIADDTDLQEAGISDEFK